MSSTDRSRSPTGRAAAKRTPSSRKAVAAPAPRNAHRGDVIEGHQLRIGNGGPGLSKFFSSKKHGGPDKARRAALKMIRDLGLPKPGKRGGSVAGRLLKTSTTPAAGIRFLWSTGSRGPLLRVVATDAGSVRDFQAFAKQTGNELVEQQTTGADFIHVLRRR
jgi:hypothetical protein